jgi:phage-related protein
LGAAAASGIDLKPHHGAHVSLRDVFVVLLHFFKKKTHTHTHTHKSQGKAAIKKMKGKRLIREI